MIEVERGATPRGETVPKILHVEDDQSLTAIVREALSRNANVTSARSLTAARQQLGHPGHRAREEAVLGEPDVREAEALGEPTALGQLLGRGQAAEHHPHWCRSVTC